MTTYPRPSYPSPHNFLALASIIVIVCSIINLTSMAIGIPAVIFSILVCTLYVCLCVLMWVHILLYTYVCTHILVHVYMHCTYMHMQATNSASSGNWNVSRKYGSVSLYLSLGTMIYTLIIALVLLGVSMGLAYRDRCHYHGNSTFSTIIVSIILLSNLVVAP